MPQKIEFAEALRNGLNPDSRTPENSPYLEECIGCRATEYGLSTHRTFSIKAPNGADFAVTPATGVVFAYPHPQLFLGDDKYLFCTDEHIYEIDKGTYIISDDITLYEAKDVDWPADSVETVTVATSPDGWVHADFGKAWFLTNGNTFIGYLPHTGSWQALAGTVAGDNCITVGALGKVGRRLVVGDLAGATYFATDAWTAIFTALQERDSTSAITYDDMAISTNWIMWSMEAGGEYYYPFVAFMGALGMMHATPYAKMNKAIISMVEQGKIGLMHLPECGQIKSIKELNGLAIVYGDRGIAAVSLEDGSYRVLSKQLGMTSRHAVVATPRGHYFWAKDNELHLLDSQMNITNLGYKALVSYTEAVLTYDETEDEVYMIDSTGYGYVLTKTGMSATAYKPLSMNLVGSSALISMDTYIGNAQVISNTYFSANITDWTPGDGTIAYANFGMAFTNSTADAVQANADQASALVTGSTYLVKIIIAAMTEGSITVKLGTTSGTELTADGVYFEEITAGGATPDITIASDGADTTCRIEEISCIKVYAARFTTWYNDGGTRDPVTIIGVEIAGGAHDGAVALIHHRMNKDDAFTETSTVSFDDRGVAPFKVTCFDFKVEVHFVDATESSIDRLTVLLAESGKLGLKEMLTA